MKLFEYWVYLIGHLKIEKDLKKEVFCQRKQCCKGWGGLIWSGFELYHNRMILDLHLGICNWLVAIPADVVKSRLQAAPYGKYTGKNYINILSIV